MLVPLLLRRLQFLANASIMPKAASLGHWIRFVTALPVGSSSINCSIFVTQCAVVHGGNLEAHGEYRQWCEGAYGPTTVRIEVPPKLAVEAVTEPILEFGVDLRVWQIFIVLPQMGPPLDTNGVCCKGRHAFSRLSQIR